ncbi:MAG: bifunctional UDP-3-O-[3-hydroxymyristoyl] N-acetylglucosamine deacetylase/3-hydroxyacyl-ACP dehydratase [Saprospiraceae bacterium]|nr:bifunctional UDP-3-O-[3-hydroxymyristoyl] N-acetylglucosamine deacetylase/3-hydroxyacyl-ACP dehydratase [Saprospiraceae bacterium]
MKEQTIKRKIAIHGKGLHTGQEVKVTFNPATTGHGIQFKRIDLEGQPSLKAEVKHVVPSQRNTTLKKGETSIATVEHALAAIAGLQIDNLLIEVDGPELPILDGSSIQFVQALKEAEIEVQDKDREYLVIEKHMVIRDEETDAEFVLIPSDTFEITTLIDYNSNVLGKQHASLKGIENFEAEIADARTFVFLHELESLIDAGLIKGGDLDNAVVFVSELLDDAELERLAKKLNRPSIKVERQGILNTTELRHWNEPARHKLLDVIGDLSLAGKYIKGKIIATKPGHSVNQKVAQKLQDLLKKQRKTREIPHYYPNKTPIFDSIAISQRLQHRFPFLLIDKIIEMSDKHIVGVKNVTVNEPFFPGHFPGNPVMPGVLQIEAMAQTGGILVLNSVDDPHEWDTYFLRIDNARFRHKVIPGDTIMFKMEYMRPSRRGLCEMRGRAFVGDKLVAEAELLAQIIKRK